MRLFLMLERGTFTRDDVYFVADLKDSAAQLGDARAGDKLVVNEPDVVAALRKYLEKDAEGNRSFLDKLRGLKQDIQLTLSPEAAQDLKHVYGVDVDLLRSQMSAGEAMNLDLGAYDAPEVVGPLDYLVVEVVSVVRWFNGNLDLVVKVVVDKTVEAVVQTTRWMGYKL